MTEESAWLKNEISKMTKKIASLKKKPSCTLYDMDIRALTRKRTHYKERLATVKRLYGK